MRATLLDELNQPYVETARAKGVSEFRLLMKYPVRVALNPIASTIGWLLPAMFSGDAITAIVMNLPTVGPVLLQSLLTEDGPDPRRHLPVGSGADVDRSAHPC